VSAMGGSPASTPVQLGLIGAGGISDVTDLADRGWPASYLLSPTLTAGASCVQCSKQSFNDDASCESAVQANFTVRSST